MAMSDSTCELHGDQAVSLANEREDMWGSSQKPKLFCLYHLVAFKCSTMDHQTVPVQWFPPSHFRFVPLNSYLPL